jgi:superfamily II RNA helicase
MTTEILQNLLYNNLNKCHKSINCDVKHPIIFNDEISDNDEISENSMLSMNNVDELLNINIEDFNIDIQNELACVIFDEVHYINDAGRGHVWEETIIMLPEHIQMVMLSATIDKPEIFAKWCENRYNNNVDKKVYIASTSKRVVPLTHYSFIVNVAGVNKKIKDKGVINMIEENTNKLLLLQDHNGGFNDDKFNTVMNIHNIFYKNKILIKRQYVINKLLDFLKSTQRLPAICFVLSKKVLELCAKEVTVNLIDLDIDNNHLVKNECMHIIRSLLNYKDYLSMPEYEMTVSLAEKGIGIHHSGMVPVLREMTEILFSKGYIKILFATETFSVGINMPTKTVIFTNIFKFDGDKNRILYPHEYTQMSGRAGRRGIDVVGNVIHLPNLFRMSEINITTMKTMMKNTPQMFISKFKISYNLLINTIINGTINLDNYIQQSMSSIEINANVKSYNNLLNDIQTTINLLNCLAEQRNTPYNIILEYMDLKQMLQTEKRNKIKKIYNKIDKIIHTYPDITTDIEIYNKLKFNNDKYNNLLSEQQEHSNYLLDITNNMLRVLLDNGFITFIDIMDRENIYITQKGLLSSQFHEVHGLIFANACLTYDLFKNKYAQNDNNSTDIINNIDGFSNNNTNNDIAISLIAIFSCLIDIRVPDDFKTLSICFDNGGIIDSTLNLIKQDYDNYKCIEDAHHINSGFNYDGLSYDLVEYVIKWSECNTEIECKSILNLLWIEKEISSGDFIKAILKINCIALEFENVARYLNNIELLEQLQMIPNLTMKYVVMTQSLYV